MWLSTLDKINEDGNGQLTVQRFNRYLWMAILRTMDWLSGDVANIIPPTPYTAQKDRDWLSPFITKYSTNTVGGKITKPEDYYGWDNAFLLGNYNDLPEDCEEEIFVDNCNIPIELLSGDEFYYRCITDIEGLQPSLTKPICKEVGNTFEFRPFDLGSMTLEYLRYPVKARLGVVMDNVHNQEVYDPLTSVDLDWPQYAEDVISWFIADMFFNFVSNQAGKTFNVQSGKTVRDSK